MFRHLLVPLDGSRLAESALPAAAELARHLGAEVTLLHVLEQSAPETVHGDRHLGRPDEAVTYLADAAQWLAARGLTARYLVQREEGDVAASIASPAGDVGADLVVLCTHGSGGLRGLLFGRVAQQVLQHGTTRVFLVQPSTRGREQAFTCRRLLVPLDGSEMAATALPPAAAMAGAFGAEMLLMMVVPTIETISGERAAATRLMPTTAAAVLDVEAAQAATYLQTTAARLEREGRRVTAAVARGDPVRVLLDAAARRDVDLITMATHGHSGMAAVWAGSVASRIVAHSTRPVLLIRVAAP